MVRPSQLTPMQRLLLAISLPITLVFLYFLFRKNDDEDDEEADAQVLTSRQTIIEVKVPHDAVGAVIGVQGAQIKMIRNVSKARLNFKDKDTDTNKDRILVIQGTQEGAQKAELMVRQIIVDQPQVVTEVIQVPNAAVGRIIGRSGETIRSISHQSKAKVTVERMEPHDISDVTQIVLKGTPLAVETAKMLISEKVEDQKAHQKTSSEKLKRTDKAETKDKSRMQTDGDGSFLEVYVSAVEHPGHFWVQFLDRNALRLSQLADEMTMFYGSFSETHNEDFEPVVGDIVAAPFSEDNTWYRAQIVGVLGDEVDLYFVDYGDSLVISKERIRRLRTDFRELPFQAKECSLANVEPCDGDVWPEEAIVAFEGLVHVAQWKALMSRNVDLTTTDVPSLQLIDTNGETDVDVAEELVRRGLAVHTSSKTRSSLLPSADKVAASILTSKDFGPHFGVTRLQLTEKDHHSASGNRLHADELAREQRDQSFVSADILLEPRGSAVTLADRCPGMEASCMTLSSTTLDTGYFSADLSHLPSYVTGPYESICDHMNGNSYYNDGDDDDNIGAEEAVVSVHPNLSLGFSPGKQLDWERESNTMPIVEASQLEVSLSDRLKGIELLEKTEVSSVAKVESLEYAKLPLQDDTTCETDLKSTEAHRSCLMLQSIEALDAGSLASDAKSDMISVGPGMNIHMLLQEGVQRSTELNFFPRSEAGDLLVETTVHSADGTEMKAGRKSLSASAEVPSGNTVDVWPLQSLEAALSDIPTESSLPVSISIAELACSPEVVSQFLVHLSESYPSIENSLHLSKLRTDLNLSSSEAVEAHQSCLTEGRPIALKQLALVNLANEYLTIRESLELTKHSVETDANFTRTKQVVGTDATCTETKQFVETDANLTKTNQVVETDATLTETEQEEMFNGLHEAISETDTLRRQKFCDLSKSYPSVQNSLLLSDQRKVLSQELQPHHLDNSEAAVIHSKLCVEYPSVRECLALSGSKPERFPETGNLVETLQQQKLAIEKVSSLTTVPVRMSEDDIEFMKSFSDMNSFMSLSKNTNTKLETDQILQKAEEALKSRTEYAYHEIVGIQSGSVLTTMPEWRDGTGSRQSENESIVIQREPEIEQQSIVTQREPEIEQQLIVTQREPEIEQQPIVSQRQSEIEQESFVIRKDPETELEKVFLTEPTEKHMVEQNDLSLNLKQIYKFEIDNVSHYFPAFCTLGEYDSGNFHLKPLVTVRPEWSTDDFDGLVSYIKGAEDQYPSVKHVHKRLADQHKKHDHISKQEPVKLHEHKTKEGKIVVLPPNLAAQAYKVGLLELKSATVEEVGEDQSVSRGEDSDDGGFVVVESRKRRRLRSRGSNEREQSEEAIETLSLIEHQHSPTVQDQYEAVLAKDALDQLSEAGTLPMETIMQLKELSVVNQSVSMSTDFEDELPQSQKSVMGMECELQYTEVTAEEKEIIIPEAELQRFAEELTEKDVQAQDTVVVKKLAGELNEAIPFKTEVELLCNEKQALEHQETSSVWSVTIGQNELEVLPNDSLPIQESEAELLETKPVEIELHSEASETIPALRILAAESLDVILVQKKINEPEMNKEVVIEPVEIVQKEHQEVTTVQKESTKLCETIAFEEEMKAAEKESSIEALSTLSVSEGKISTGNVLKVETAMTASEKESAMEKYFIPFQEQSNTEMRQIASSINNEAYMPDSQKLIFFQALEKLGDFEAGNLQLEPQTKCRPEWATNDFDALVSYIAGDQATEHPDMHHAPGEAHDHAKKHGHSKLHDSSKLHESAHKETKSVVLPPNLAATVFKQHQLEFELEFEKDLAKLEEEEVGDDDFKVVESRKRRRVHSRSSVENFDSEGDHEEPSSEGREDFLHITQEICETEPQVRQDVVIVEKERGISNVISQMQTKEDKHKSQLICDKRETSEQEIVLNSRELDIEILPFAVIQKEIECEKQKIETLQEIPSLFPSSADEHQHPIEDSQILSGFIQTETRVTLDESYRSETDSLCCHFPALSRLDDYESGKIQFKPPVKYRPEWATNDVDSLVSYIDGDNKKQQQLHSHPKSPERAKPHQRSKAHDRSKAHEPTAEGSKSITLPPNLAAKAFKAGLLDIDTDLGREECAREEDDSFTVVESRKHKRQRNRHSVEKEEFEEGNQEVVLLEHQESLHALGHDDTLLFQREAVLSGNEPEVRTTEPAEPVIAELETHEAVISSNEPEIRPEEPVEPVITEHETVLSGNEPEVTPVKPVFTEIESQAAVLSSNEPEVRPEEPVELVITEHGTREAVLFGNEPEVTPVKPVITEFESQASVLSSNEPEVRLEETVEPVITEHETRAAGISGNEFQIRPEGAVKPVAIECETKSVELAIGEHTYDDQYSFASVEESKTKQLEHSLIPKEGEGTIQVDVTENQQVLPQVNEPSLSENEGKTGQKEIIDCDSVLDVQEELVISKETNEQLKSAVSKYEVLTETESGGLQTLKTIPELHDQKIVIRERQRDMSELELAVIHFPALCKLKDYEMGIVKLQPTPAKYRPEWATDDVDALVSYIEGDRKELPESHVHPKSQEHTKSHQHSRAHGHSRSHEPSNVHEPATASNKIVPLPPNLAAAAFKLRAIDIDADLKKEDCVDEEGEMDDSFTVVESRKQRRQRNRHSVEKEGCEQGNRDVTFEEHRELLHAQEHYEHHQAKSLGWEEPEMKDQSMIESRKEYESVATENANEVDLDEIACKKVIEGEQQLPTVIPEHLTEENLLHTVSLSEQQECLLKVAQSEQHEVTNDETVESTELMSYHQESVKVGVQLLPLESISDLHKQQEPTVNLKESVNQVDTHVGQRETAASLIAQNQSDLDTVSHHYTALCKLSGYESVGKGLDLNEESLDTKRDIEIELNKEQPVVVSQEEQHFGPEKPVVSQEELNFVPEEPVVSQKELYFVPEEPVVSQEELNFGPEKPVVSQEELNFVPKEPVVSQEELNFGPEKPVVSQEELNFVLKEPVVSQEELHFEPQESAVCQKKEAVDEREEIECSKELFDSQELVICHETTYQMEVGVDHVELLCNQRKPHILTLEQGLILEAAGSPKQDFGDIDHVELIGNLKNSQNMTLGKDDHLQETEAEIDKQESAQADLIDKKKSGILAIEHDVCLQASPISEKSVPEKETHTEHLEADTNLQDSTSVIYSQSDSDKVSHHFHALCRLNDYESGKIQLKSPVKYRSEWKTNDVDSLVSYIEGDHKEHLEVHGHPKSHEHVKSHHHSKTHGHSKVHEPSKAHESATESNKIVALPPNLAARAFKAGLLDIDTDLGREECASEEDDSFTVVESRKHKRQRNRHSLERAEFEEGNQEVALLEHQESLHTQEHSDTLLSKSNNWGEAEIEDLQPLNPVMESKLVNEQPAIIAKEPEVDLTTPKRADHEVVELQRVYPQSEFDVNDVKSTVSQTELEIQQIEGIKEAGFDRQGELHVVQRQFIVEEKEVVVSQMKHVLEQEGITVNQSNSEPEHQEPTVAQNEKEATGKDRILRDAYAQLQEHYSQQETHTDKQHDLNHSQQESDIELRETCSGQRFPDDDLQDRYKLKETEIENIVWQEKANTEFEEFSINENDAKVEKHIHMEEKHEIELNQADFQKVQDMKPITKTVVGEKEQSKGLDKEAVFGMEEPGSELLQAIVSGEKEEILKQLEEAILDENDQEIEVIAEENDQGIEVIEEVTIDENDQEIEVIQEAANERKSEIGFIHQLIACEKQTAVDFTEELNVDESEGIAILKEPVVGETKSGIEVEAEPHMSQEELERLGKSIISKLTEVHHQDLSKEPDLDLTRTNIEVKGELDFSQKKLGGSLTSNRSKVYYSDVDKVSHHFAALSILNDYESGKIQFKPPVKYRSEWKTNDVDSLVSYIEGDRKEHLEGHIHPKSHEHVKSHHHSRTHGHSKVHESSKSHESATESNEIVALPPNLAARAFKAGLLDIDTDLDREECASEEDDSFTVVESRKHKRQRNRHSVEKEEFEEGNQEVVLLEHQESLHAQEHDDTLLEMSRVMEESFSATQSEQESDQHKPLSVQSSENLCLISTTVNENEVCSPCELAEPENDVELLVEKEVIITGMQRSDIEQQITQDEMNDKVGESIVVTIKDRSQQEEISAHVNVDTVNARGEQVEITECGNVDTAEDRVKQKAVTGHVDAETVMDRREQQKGTKAVTDAVIEHVDVDTVNVRGEQVEITEHDNVDTAEDRVDQEAVTEHVDVDTIMDRSGQEAVTEAVTDAVIEHVDVDAVKDKGEQDEVTEHVNVDTVLDRSEQEAVTDAVTEHVDVDTVLDRSELEAATEHVDVDTVLDRSEQEAVTEHVDVDTVLDRSEQAAVTDAVTEHVNVDTVENRSEQEAVTEHVDVDTVLDRSELEAATEHVDVDTVLDRSEQEVVTEHVDVDTVLDRSEQEAVTDAVAEHVNVDTVENRSEQEAVTEHVDVDTVLDRSEQEAATEHVDVDTVLDRSEQEAVTDAVTEHVDVDTVLDRSELEAATEHVDVDTVLDRSEQEAVTEHVDVDTVLDRSEQEAVTDAVAEHVNVGTVENRSEQEAVTEHVDVDTVLDRSELEAATEHVDVDTVLDRSEQEAVTDAVAEHVNVDTVENRSEQEAVTEHVDVDTVLDRSEQEAVTDAFTEHVNVDIVESRSEQEAVTEHVDVDTVLDRSEQEAVTDAVAEHVNVDTVENRSEQEAVTEHVDVDTVLDRSEQEAVTDAVAEHVNVDTVENRSEQEAVTEHVDVDTVLDRSELEAATEHVDVDTVLDRSEQEAVTDAVAEHVNVDTVENRSEQEAVTEHVDVDTVLDRSELGAATEHVDVDTVLDRSEQEAVTDAFTEHVNVDIVESRSEQEAVTEHVDVDTVLDRSEEEAVTEHVDFDTVKATEQSECPTEFQQHFISPIELGETPVCKKETEVETFVKLTEVFQKHCEAETVFQDSELREPLASRQQICVTESVFIADLAESGDKPEDFLANTDVLIQDGKVEFTDQLVDLNVITSSTDRVIEQLPKIAKNTIVINEDVSVSHSLRARVEHDFESVAVTTEKEIPAVAEDDRKIGEEIEVVEEVAGWMAPSTKRSEGEDVQILESFMSLASECRPLVDTVVEDSIEHDECLKVAETDHGLEIVNSVTQFDLLRNEKVTERDTWMCDVEESVATARLENVSRDAEEPIHSSKLVLTEKHSDVGVQVTDNAVFEANIRIATAETDKQSTAHDFERPQMEELFSTRQYDRRFHEVAADASLDDCVEPSLDVDNEASEVSRMSLAKKEHDDVDKSAVEHLKDNVNLEACRGFELSQESWKLERSVDQGLCVERDDDTSVQPAVGPLDALLLREYAGHTWSTSSGTTIKQSPPILGAVESQSPMFPSPSTTTEFSTSSSKDSIFIDEPNPAVIVSSGKSKKRKKQNKSEMNKEDSKHTDEGFRSSSMKEPLEEQPHALVRVQQIFMETIEKSASLESASSPQMDELVPDDKENVLDSSHVSEASISGSKEIFIDETKSAVVVSSGKSKKKKKQNKSEKTKEDSKDTVEGFRSSSVKEPLEEQPLRIQQIYMETNEKSASVERGPSVQTDELVPNDKENVIDSTKEVIDETRPALVVGSGKSKKKKKQNKSEKTNEDSKGTDEGFRSSSMKEPLEEQPLRVQQIFMETSEKSASVESASSAQSVPDGKEDIPNSSHVSEILSSFSKKEIIDKTNPAVVVGSGKSKKKKKQNKSEKTKEDSKGTDEGFRSISMKEPLEEQPHDLVRVQQIFMETSEKSASVKGTSSAQAVPDDKENVPDSSHVSKASTSGSKEILIHETRPAVVVSSSKSKKKKKQNKSEKTKEDSKGMDEGFSSSSMKEPLEEQPHDLLRVQQIFMETNEKSASVESASSAQADDFVLDDKENVSDSCHVSVDSTLSSKRAAIIDKTNPAVVVGSSKNKKKKKQNKSEKTKEDSKGMDEGFRSSSMKEPLEEQPHGLLRVQQIFMETDEKSTSIGNASSALANELVPDDKENFPNSCPTLQNSKKKKNKKKKKASSALQEATYETGECTKEVEVVAPEYSLVSSGKMTSEVNEPCPEGELGGNTNSSDVSSPVISPINDKLPQENRQISGSASCVLDQPLPRAGASKPRKKNKKGSMSSETPSPTSVEKKIEDIMLSHPEVAHQSYPDKNVCTEEFVEDEEMTPATLGMIDMNVSSDSSNLTKRARRKRKKGGKSGCENAGVQIEPNVEMKQSVIESTSVGSTVFVESNQKEASVKDAVVEGKNELKQWVTATNLELKLSGEKLSSQVSKEKFDLQACDTSELHMTNRDLSEQVDIADNVDDDLYDSVDEHVTLQTRMSNEEFQKESSVESSNGRLRSSEESKRARRRRKRQRRRLKDRGLLLSGDLLTPSTAGCENSAFETVQSVVRPVWPVMSSTRYSSTAFNIDEASKTSVAIRGKKRRKKTKSSSAQKAADSEREESVQQSEVPNMETRAIPHEGEGYSASNNKREFDTEIGFTCSGESKKKRKRAKATLAQTNIGATVAAESDVNSDQLQKVGQVKQQNIEFPVISESVVSSKKFRTGSELPILSKRTDEMSEFYRLSGQQKSKGKPRKHAEPGDLTEKVQTEKATIHQVLPLESWDAAKGQLLMEDLKTSGSDINLCSVSPRLAGVIPEAEDKKKKKNKKKTSVEAPSTCPHEVPKTTANQDVPVSSSLVDAKHPDKYGKPLQKAFKKRENIPSLARGLLNATDGDKEGSETKKAAKVVTPVQTAEEQQVVTGRHTYSYEDSSKVGMCAHQDGRPFQIPNLPLTSLDMMGSSVANTELSVESSCPSASVRMAQTEPDELGEKLKSSEQARTRSSKKKVRGQDWDKATESNKKTEHHGQSIEETKTMIAFSTTTAPCAKKHSIATSAPCDWNETRNETCLMTEPSLSQADENIKLSQQEFAEQGSWENYENRSLFSQHLHLDPTSLDVFSCDKLLRSQELRQEVESPDHDFELLPSASDLSAESGTSTQQSTVSFHEAHARHQEAEILSKSWQTVQLPSALHVTSSSSSSADAEVEQILQGQPVSDVTVSDVGARKKFIGADLMMDSDLEPGADVVVTVTEVLDLEFIEETEVVTVFESISDPGPPPSETWAFDRPKMSTRISPVAGKLSGDSEDRKFLTSVLSSGPKDRTQSQPDTILCSESSNEMGVEKQDEEKNAGLSGSSANVFTLSTAPLSDIPVDPVDVPLAFDGSSKSSHSVDLSLSSDASFQTIGDRFVLTEEESSLMTDSCRRLFDQTAVDAGSSMRDSSGYDEACQFWVSKESDATLASTWPSVMYSFDKPDASGDSTCNVKKGTYSTPTTSSDDVGPDRVSAESSGTNLDSYDDSLDEELTLKVAEFQSDEGSGGDLPSAIGGQSKALVMSGETWDSLSNDSLEGAAGNAAATATGSQPESSLGNISEDSLMDGSGLQVHPGPSSVESHSEDFFHASARQTVSDNKEQHESDLGSNIDHVKTTEGSDPKHANDGSSKKTKRKKKLVRKAQQTDASSEQESDEDGGAKTGL